MEWVIGYVVVWFLFSGWLASDNPEDGDRVCGSVLIGAMWIVAIPLAILFFIIKGLGTLFKKAGL